MLLFKKAINSFRLFVVFYIKNFCPFLVFNQNKTKNELFIDLIPDEIIMEK